MRPFTSCYPILLTSVVLLSTACVDSDDGADTTVSMPTSVATTAQPTTPATQAATTDAGAETTISIDAGDHVIPGIFTAPMADGSTAEYPTVLMLHGFGADKNEGGNMFGRLAGILADAGYASLRIDFAGAGDSAQPWIENNFDGMVADATRALDWLSAHDSVHADRIGVHGWSFGGRVSATLAGTDNRVRTLSTWAGAIQDGTEGLVPFFSMPIRNCTSDPGRETLYECAVDTGSVLYDPFGTGPFELSRLWFETMKASQAFTLVRDFEGPQLAVHGELDRVVRPSVSRSAIARSGSHDATLRIIPGADHAFGVYDAADPGIIAEDVLSITARWIEEKL